MVPYALILNAVVYFGRNQFSRRLISAIIKFCNAREANRASAALNGVAIMSEG
jgi:hypothetical protein